MIGLKFNRPQTERSIISKSNIRWSGKCWYIHELVKYEFDVEFEVFSIL